MAARACEGRPDRYPGAVSSRIRDLLIAFAVVAGVAIAAWAASRGRPVGPSEPLGYVPAEAAAVGYLKVDPVTASPLVRALFPEGTGVERMKQLCGFNPTAGIRDMLVFVGGQNEEALGPFGLVARGTLERDRLGECLRKVVAEGGGSTRITRMEGVPAVASGGGSSRAAFIGDDAVTVGNAEVVRQVLRTARGKAPSAAAGGTLADLWERVGSGRDVALVADLPERWQRVVSGLARQRLGVDPGNVQALGVGADLGRGLKLGGIVRTASPEGSRRVVEALQARIRQLRAEPIVAFSVLGTVLRRVKLAADGPEIVVTLHLDEKHVDELAQLLGGAHAPQHPAEPPPAGSAQEAQPDAILQRGQREQNR